MRIRDILAEKGSHVVTLWPERRLDQVARVLDERNIASVVIEDHGGHHMGIVTEREFVHTLARLGASALDLPAGEVMSPAFTCTADDTVGDVLRLMTDNRVRHVLVLRDDGVMVGIVSIGDLVKVRLDDAEMENRVLRELALARFAG